MSNNDAIILPLLESMDQKELLTIISMANGLIKTKQMAEQKQNPLDGLIQVFITALATEGIHLAESFFHKHRKTIADAAAPVTEAIAAKTCQPPKVWNGTECVDDVG